MINMLDGGYEHLQTNFKSYHKNAVLVCGGSFRRKIEFKL